MKKSLYIGRLLMGLLFSGLHANLAIAGDAEIKQAFSSIGLNEVEIMPSPLAGMKTALTAAGIFYISEDGKNLIKGPLFTIEQGAITNVSNQVLMGKLKNLESSMIVYKAKEEKYVVTVFTDISCSYCQKLHENIQGYNDLGITIRYLAYPRAGVDSPVGRQMESIWCSADRVKAFDQVQRGEELTAQCYVASIANQYKLGTQFGIRGTPALVFTNGDLLPGYLSPQDLKAELDKRPDLKK